MHEYAINMVIFLQLVYWCILKADDTMLFGVCVCVWDAESIQNSNSEYRVQISSGRPKADEWNYYLYLHVFEVVTKIPV